jgi:hypothetical protein
MFKYLLVTIGFCRWCITFRNIEFSDSIHRPGIKNKLRETRRFGNWICYRPQVREKTPILLGPLERASPNHWTTDVTNHTGYKYLRPG